MKKIGSLLLSLLAGLGLISGSPAMAQDSFERDFSKFDKDFERLNAWKAETPASKKLKRAPAPASAVSTDHDAAGTTVPLNDDAHAPAAKASGEPANDHPASTKGSDKSSAVSQDLPGALPKGAKVERLARNDRLGNQISDPVMRKKVQDLYKRPDVVVQQYVLPTN